MEEVRDQRLGKDVGKLIFSGEEANV
jgi:hypothetical protein